MKNWGVVNVIKLFQAFLAGVLLLIVYVDTVSANCFQIDGPFFQCGTLSEQCSDDASGEAFGTAVYSCGSYIPQQNCTGCYFHHYRCDTSCGNSGETNGCPCGRNNRGECARCGGPICNLATINCPPGTIRGSTIIGSQCENYACNPGYVGSAQQVGDCCNWEPGDTICGDWYPIPCGGGGQPKCQRDCETEPDTCKQYNYNQYNCVTTCAATAPTNVTFTPISLTSARLDWTPGTDGTTQYVYIGTNKADVEANCASGTCAVSEIS